MACYVCRRTKIGFCGEGCGLCEDVGLTCVADEDRSLPEEHEEDVYPA